MKKIQNKSFANQTFNVSADISPTRKITYDNEGCVILTDDQAKVLLTVPGCEEIEFTEDKDKNGKKDNTNKTETEQSQETENQIIGKEEVVKPKVGDIKWDENGKAKRYNENSRWVNCPEADKKPEENKTENTPEGNTKTENSK